MIRRPPRSTLSSSSAASDVYKRQMYDFAHGQSDYFEGVTHSLCTLEFEVHRPLYDWFIDQLKTTDYRLRPVSYNRLNLTYTMMSKRKLLELVQEGKVRGWDD